MGDEERRAASVKERNHMALVLQAEVTNLIGRYVLKDRSTRALKLGGAMVEWTQVVDRQEIRCAIYLDTRVEIDDLDDPGP